MPESEVHAVLVRRMMEWIADEFLDGDLGAVCHDSAGRVALSVPHWIQNFVPDVFVPAMSEVPLIVGEAKTARDLDTIHSRKQISAFLTYCEEQPISVFVLSVPWYVVPHGRAMIHQICKRNGLVKTNVSILELLPG